MAEKAAAAGLEPDLAGWELHRHNPPYTLGMFRTNEVLVPVKKP